MQHRHPAAKMRQKQLHQAGGQGDLRDHDNGPPPRRQGPLDQVEIDLGLAAAGNAIQQRSLGAVLLQQGGQALIGFLLLLVQVGQRTAILLQRQGAAEHFSFLERQNAPFFQGLDRLAGGPGKVTQFFHTGAAQAAQEAGHLPAHGRAFPPGLHTGEGLGGVHGQHGDLLRLVPDLAPGRGLPDHQPRPFQLPQNAPGIVQARQGLQLLQRAATAAGLQKGQHLTGPGPVLGLLLPVFPVCVGRQGIALFQHIPQPGGQHGEGRVVHGAEEPLPHPQRQLQALFG